MAGNDVKRDDDEGLIRFDVLWTTLHSSRRWIVGLTLSVTAFVATLGFVYLVWMQPVRTVATLDFSPTFKGASEQIPTYPNGVPFSESDILAGNVLDTVFEQNQLADFCALNRFKSSFFVDRQSTEAAFLASDYESRMAQPGLTVIERNRLEAEYQAKRLALPLSLRLVFAEPPECARLPETLIRKSMSDTLTLWADESQRTRGVLSLPISKFQPEAFDPPADNLALIARGDLIRTQLSRILATADEAVKAPGAVTVRLKSGDSLPELRARLADVIHVTEPLIAAAGQAGGRDGLRWAELRLASADATYQSARGQEDVYRRALADYTAQAIITEPGMKLPSKSSTDVAQIVPQLDQSFVASVMVLAEDHVKYRQELTERMAKAGLSADPYRAPVIYYQTLVDAIGHGERSSMTAAQINAQLDAVAAQGKALTTRFNELIDEIGRVTLDVASGLYRTTNATTIVRERAFTPELWALMVVLTFFATLILTALWALVRGRLRAIVTV